MNILNTIEQHWLSFPLCIVSGYVFSSITVKVHKFVMNFLKDESVVHEENSIENRYSENLDPEGTMLYDHFLRVIRQELSYRFVLETIILPRIFSQFATFSITRVCVANLLYSSDAISTTTKLESSVSKGSVPLSTTKLELEVSKVFNTFLLGMICSFAQQRTGLIASIFFQIGYQLPIYQKCYHQNLNGVMGKITELGRAGIPPLSVCWFLCDMIYDLMKPLDCAYQIGRKMKIIPTNFPITIFKP